MKSTEILDKVIEKSSERIESATILFRAGKYSDSLSRSYYAMFDLVVGLLETGKVFAKSHHGAIAKFNELFIKTRKFDQRFARILKKAEKAREEADYSFLYEATKEDAKTELEEAKEFLRAVQKYAKGA